MQPSPKTSAASGAVGGALARRKLGGSTASRVAGGVGDAMAAGGAPSAPPDASQVAAKLPGLKGFRLATGMPQPKMMPSAPMFADKVGRAAPPAPVFAPPSIPAGDEGSGVSDEALARMMENAGDIPSLAGVPPAPLPEVQGRALNADGTSITGRGGNRQELGANALRKLGAGGGVPRPPGLKGFRLPPGLAPRPDIPTDEMAREVGGGLESAIAEEPPMELAPPRRPGGGRMGRRTLGY